MAGAPGWSSEGRSVEATQRHAVVLAKVCHTGGSSIAVRSTARCLRVVFRTWKGAQQLTQPGFHARVAGMDVRTVSPDWASQPSAFANQEVSEERGHQDLRR
jgi:hypothetical protein